MDGTSMVVNSNMNALHVNLRKRVSEQLDDFSPTQMEAIQNAIMRINAVPEVGNKSSIQLAISIQ